MNDTERIQNLESQIKDMEELVNRIRGDVATGGAEMSDVGTTLFGGELAIRLMRAKVSLLKQDCNFPFLTLFNLDEEVVSSKIVNTRYGRAFIIEHEDGKPEFVNPNVKPSTLAKKGYKIGYMEFKAWVTIQNDTVHYFKTGEEQENE